MRSAFGSSQHFARKFTNESAVESLTSRHVVNESGTHQMSFGLLAPLTLAALAFVTTLRSPPPPPVVHSTIRVVDVRGAAALVARGASVLDARDGGAFSGGHIPGAQLYAWSLFTGPAAARGRLRSDLDSVAAGLAALGVDETRPTLVYGAAGLGQGEEGHAAWLLALLGHPDIAMLDGGFDAWRSAGRPVVTTTAAARVGRFSARVRSELLIDRARLGGRGPRVLDVRSSAEFVGASPRGEARGGHIPGALSMDWRTVLDERGRIRPVQKLRESLESAGVDASEPFVVVCTNGVRSGFVASVLAARSIAAPAVVDGGMLEWAADPSAPLSTT
jgi:thiosulfate/3-mercaptopyruvate sulfurtransferase